MGHIQTVGGKMPFQVKNLNGSVGKIKQNKLFLPKVNVSNYDEDTLEFN
jgi:hypothetical protein